MRKALLAAVAIIATCAATAYAYPTQSEQLPGSTVKVVMAAGHGSGVHIGNGYVLTAAHVLGNGEPKLKLDDGSEQPATVLWQNKGHDVALLRTDATMAAAPLSCTALYDGQTIIAKGNPSQLEFVSSAGRVVGTPREVGPWKVAVVVDMTIVMGMSGGPTLDAAGRVVGINVGVLSTRGSLTGFGFIVPGSVVCELLART